MVLLSPGDPYLFMKTLTSIPSYIKSLEDYVAQLEQQLASSQRPANDDGLDMGLRIARLSVPSKVVPDFALSLPVSTQVTFPEHTVLMALSEKYFEHSDFFSHVLDQSDLIWLSNAARSDESSPRDHSRSKFVVFMVLATMMELLQRSQINLHLPEGTPGIPSGCIQRIASRDGLNLHQ